MTTRRVTLTFAKPGSTRSPITAALMVQDDSAEGASQVEFYAELDEHQFVSLLAGTSITVDAQITAEPTPQGASS